MKVALYIGGAGLSGIDMTAPQLGNPGIGGTEYCILQLAYWLHKTYGGEYEVEVISLSPLRLPEGVANRVIGTREELPDASVGSRILIVPQDTDPEMPFYDILDRCKGVDIIHWTHNFLFAEIADRVAQSSDIKANVFVSKQLYDFYTDHPIIFKSRPIFNMVPDADAPERGLPERPEVTFMGQILESKGFITLMEMWQEISRQRPDALLNIIGGGNLYNRDAKLGPLGIADEYTEGKFRKYVLDSEGKMRHDIRFMGILGREKYDVFARSTVGIVNPRASTETFGMGIVEMASARLPVVTRKWNGHPDTAIDGMSALLGYTKKQMVKKVLRLIDDRALNLRLGEEAKRLVKRFDGREIVGQWYALISSVAAGDARMPRQGISRPYLNNYKFLRAANALFRMRLGLKFIPPVINLETRGYRILKRLAGKIKN